MIEKMTKYSFILLDREREGFLEELAGLGVMDITRSTKPIDERSAEMLAGAESLGRRIALLESGNWVRDEQYAALLGDKEEAERTYAEREPWGAYDQKKVSALENSGVFFHYYIIPEKKFDPQWEDQYAARVICRKDGKVWMVVATSDSGSPGIPVKELPRPVTSLDEERKRIEDLKAAIARREEELETERKGLPALKAEYASRKQELDLYWARATGTKAAEDHLVIYEGFAPTQKDQALAAELDKSGAFWFREAAVTEDNPPIKLKNNKFVRMFEVLTDMYGRPDYNEFDPTPYISIFFLLFFAMCMGDAGYGLMLIIGGILLRKVDSFKDLAPLVTTLGVATFIVGIVMHTFFGVDIAALPWIPSWLKAVMITGTIGGFEAQMVLSLAIGVVHLCLAMIVKTVYATRNQGFLGSLGVWGWTLLIVGGVILAAVGMLKLIPAGILKWIVIGLGVVSALGIFLFNDIHRNPLKNIGSGLWETYNTVTGLLGDVLSYLRLYALGLAGGMLGKAFNDIAAMTLGDGGFGPGWLAFILILAIGHALNLAMCCLGAFVHPLRLNFLEFFKNSAYDGKGRKYQPLGNNNN